jgi:DNA polymerase-1
MRRTTLKTLIADIETNGLIPELNNCHCLAIGTENYDEIELYADHDGYPSIHEGLERLREADRVVFHNGFGFDFPALQKLYGLDVLRHDQIYDTLVVSRLLDPTARAHSLQAWGERLGFAKGDHDDWSTFSDTMADYCRRDVAVTQRVYRELQRQYDAEWDNALKLEFDFAYVMGLQEQHGFRLNVEACEAMSAELRQEMADIELELQEVFPPITHERWSEKTGKRLKDKVEVFNPGSRKQIAERLISMYNWVPKRYTPAGSPQIDESVLGTLKYPEATLLARYFRCQKQLSQISEGDSGWLKCVDSNNYVHGRVNTIGAATHRCAHFGPNMAQVDKKDPRMREVWLPDEGHKLVGCDADALELRMLASYLGLFDGGEYRDALLYGSKDDGTDVHSRTANLVGVNRDNAKRVTYAYLYGASDRKLTEIAKEANGKIKQGKEIRRRMDEGINGLGKLSTLVKKKAKRGFIKAVDKRRIPIKSEHSALNFLLQSAGAIVMKKALQVFHYQLCPDHGYVVDGRPVHFNYCANVHDEVQLSCEPDHAEKLGTLFAKAIELAGEQLGLLCPVSGSYDIGDNWKDTH